MASLTDEQKRRIDESKRKALALRAARQPCGSAASTQGGAQTNHNSNPTHSFKSFQSSNKSKDYGAPYVNNNNQIKPIISHTGANKNFNTSSSSAPSPYNKGQLSRQNNYGNKLNSVQRQLSGNSSSQPNYKGTTSQTLKAGSQGKAAKVDLQALVTAGGSPGKSGHYAVKGTCRLISRQRFQVEVGYNGALIETFKSMTTKQYDPQSKKWDFHLSEYRKLIQHIAGLGSHVVIEPLPRSVLSAFSATVQGRVQSAEPEPVPDADLSNVDSGLVEALMPFQRDGVNFAVAREGRVLIADDMGLGKTLQALCIAAYYRAQWPVLIVVPSSVRFAWQQQILKWLPSVDPQEIQVVTSGREGSTEGEVTIISYDLMVRRKAELQKRRYQIVIMDESHSLKNIKTARTQAAMTVLKLAKRVILLSGTPALSRPNELFTQISAVDSSIFPKFHDFGVRYCDGKKHAWGWDFSGSSNLAELQLILEEKIMIRRMKSEVMAQLPSKCRQVVILDPGSVRVNKGMKNSHVLVNKLKGSERRGALLEYFHETGGCKAPAVKEYVMDLLENDRKFLLFAHHQQVLDALEQAVVKKHGYIRIDGRTNSEQRTYLANKFQRDDSIRVALLSIAAANAGLNLTAASLVVFGELFWNPGILMQAEDRAHRIGQDDNVTVHYLVAKGTADDYLWPLVQQKLEVLGRAGLSKDDFSAADTRVMQDPKQREIVEFLEESLVEDFGDNIQKGDEPSGQPKSDSNDDMLPGQQSNLFKYFKPQSPTEGPSSCDTSNATKHVSHGNIYNEPSTSASISNTNTACKRSAEVTYVTSCKDDCDWSDDLGEEFWENDVDPDAPWPPQNKKTKYS